MHAGAALPPLLVVLSLLFSPADATGSFLVRNTCREDEFFDTAGAACLPCDANASPSAEPVEGGYQTECGCDAGRALFFEEPAEEEPLDLGVCTPCQAGSVPSKSGKYCLQCDASGGDSWLPARINAAGTACECVQPQPNRIITEMSIGGGPLMQGNGTFLQRCVQCPAGSRPDAEAGKCVPCQYPKLWNGNRCACPDVPPEGSRCSLTDSVWEAIGQRGSVSFEVTFQDVPDQNGVLRTVTVDNSAVMQDMLEDSASNCFYYGDRKACNALGNLCALQLHDRNSAPCQLYQELVDLRSDEVYHEDEVRNSGWSVTLPWLFYPIGSATSWLRATNINTRVKLSGPNGGSISEPVVSTLSFKVARFALDGEFLGWRNFTNQLQLCLGSEGALSRWTHFAVNYRNRCELPLDFLLDFADSTTMEFMDLYFEDGPGQMYPIPMILENDPENDNVLAESEYRLTRRLFSIDAVSGIESPAGSGAKPAAVRYLEKFVLRMEVQPSNTRADNGKIYPPVAILRYAARDTSPTASSAEVVNPASFEVVYAMSEGKVSDFIQAWDYLIIATMMAAITVAILKMYRYAQNEGRSTGDANAGGFLLFFEGIAVGADVGSAATFLVLVGICVYWLCFFKLQSSVFTMLPPDDGEIWYRFRVSVMCTVVGRTYAVLWMVWKQTTVDIFLLDWTEPKDELDEKREGLTKGKVSCWRTLFVANEWNELQTLRVTSIEVTMLLLIFLLSGLGLENGAVVNPDENILTKNFGDTTSQILRFGISSSIFILIEVAQVLFMKLIVYWKISNPLVDFVDLLWLSNVSMVVLNHSVGYYLHGHFSGAYVDTDAEELNIVLLSPHNDKRGFLDGDDVQTFIIFISKELRDACDDFQARVNDKYQDQRAEGAIEYALHGPKGAGGDQKLHQLSAAFRDRFQMELTKIREDPSRRVVNPGFLSLWTVMPPANSSSETVFWKDRNFSFTEVLFYGNEVSLFMLQVMLFTSIDMRLRNAAFSGSITYLIMWVLKKLRQEWGENNLSKKSLVDKKFLI